VRCAESAPGTVEVWTLRLPARVHPGVVADLLSDDERRRLRSFVSPADAAAFGTTRACLRLLLADRAGIAAAEVELLPDPRGKLAAVGAASHLCFNVSHTRAWAAIAVRRGAPVGVDIEAGPASRTTSLTKRWLLEDVAGWTAREAYVKAIGTGLRRRLDRLTVEPCRPHEHVACWRVGGDTEVCVRPLAGPRRTALAVASRGGWQPRLHTALPVDVARKLEAA